jgi:hypothetical protein
MLLYLLGGDIYGLSRNRQDVKESLTVYFVQHLVDGPRNVSQSIAQPVVYEQMWLFFLVIFKALPELHS